LECHYNVVTKQPDFVQASKWTEGSLKFVRKILEISSRIELQPFQYQNDQDLFLGEAFLYFNPADLLKAKMRAKRQPVALSKVLVKNRHAEKIGQEAHVCRTVGNFRTIIVAPYNPFLERRTVKIK
jgi:hypothetical protein